MQFNARRDFSMMLFFQGVASVLGGGTGVSSLPSFSVNKGGSAQTIGPGSDVVTFSVEDWDTANCFASNKFTPNVAGHYTFTAGLFFSVTNNDLQLFVRKNGTTNYMLQNSTTAAQVGGSVVIAMNGTTDYVELLAYHNLGGDINGDPTYTRFQGCWTGP